MKQDAVAPAKKLHPGREDDLLLVDILEPGLAALTLNAPGTRNALSGDMLSALSTAIDGISNDNAVKAVILKANGPVFCAGHDLKELRHHRSGPDRGKAFFEEIMGRCSGVMTKIMRSPKPVIAAVQGTATAAGCQLVATCDLAVCVRSAKFCTPGVNIGLFCSTPMVALSRNIPRKRAMEMLLLGDLIDAETAASFGLVNRVVDSDRLIEAALGLARQIASKSQHTVAIGKEAFYKQIDLPVDQAYLYASEVMVQNLLARDAEEGIDAFIEKRVPKWSGQ